MKQSHSFSIRKAEEGQLFHVEESDGEWIEFEAVEVEEYRSSYKADTVILEAIDGDVQRSFSKSALLDRVRSGETRFHRGLIGDCKICSSRNGGEV